MLRDISTILFLIVITFSALAFQQHPATAQASSEKPTPCGSYKEEETGVLKDITEDEGRVIIGQYSTRCGSYYAPYAIMAAAVYPPISAELEQNRRAGRNKVPDADVAVKALKPDNRLYAKALLRGWSYQFGSEGYTACLHDKDEAYPEDDACKRSLPGRIRRLVGSYTDFAFNVWTHRRRRASCSEVSIVFRGTTNLADYVSSGYRYTGWVADTGYHQLERNIDAIIGRIAKLNCYRNETQIVSVGHSLGAGLAELAAFAPRVGGPRIAKVFAFNPSSESGYKLVDQKRLASNAGSKDEKNSSLEIDYVYHPGEILEQERVWIPQYPIKQRCFPLVRTVRFDVSEDRGLVAQHKIGNFADGIVKTSMNARTLSAPPTVSGCDTRYRRPEGEGELVAAAPEQAIYARGVPLAKTAATSRYGFTSTYATETQIKKQEGRAFARPAALQRELDIGSTFAMTGYGG